MSSLLRMSDQELEQVDTGSRLGLLPQLGLSVSASVCALVGLLLRYSPGDEVPIVGLDEPLVQLKLSAALGGAMLVGALLIRGVFMKRLQWAVLTSLLIHLSICLTLKTLVVEVPFFSVAEIGVNNVIHREFTLPDYGGAEAQDNPSQQWKQPTEIEVAESERQQMERIEAEMEIQAEPELVETERRVENIAAPDRVQDEQHMDSVPELELQKQILNARADAPEQLLAPEIQTQQTQQADLEAQEMNRADSVLEDAQRQLEDVESKSRAEANAMAVASRVEVRPQSVMQLTQQQQRREAAEAKMAESATANVELAAAEAAKQTQPAARILNSARQTQSDLTDRERAASRITSSAAQMRIDSATPSRSDTNNQLSANSTPSGGGSAALQRSSTANGRSISAANATASSVEIASAGSASSASISVSPSASRLAKGSASVPTTAAAGAPTMQASRSGMSALQSGSAGRSRGATSGPKLGSAVGDDSSGTFGGSARGGVEGVLGSVGSQAESVAISGAAASGGSTQQVLSGGPAGTASNVGRSAMGLPADELGSGSGLGMVSSGSVGGGIDLVMNSSVRAGLAGRATEPSAQLDRSVNGAASALAGAGSRRAADISLPSGALAAESAGGLVIAGPQAPGREESSASGISGPRSTSVARRSSGLAGAASGPSSMARSRPQLPGLVGSVASAVRSSSSGSQPRIATGSEVAAMFRHSVPGISPLPTERVSAGFSMRTPQARAEAIDKLGGSDASETAVDRGLEWLAVHQFAAGNWSIHELNCKDHLCTGNGSYRADPAATGLALLAFLGAGHTHKTGDYQQTVERGLDWLTKQQKSDGNLFPAESEFAGFYGHGIATIALSEAFGMTKDNRLREPAQKALNYIVQSQHPEFGGWRYRPQFETDTSVSGWQLMALKSGEMGGLKVPRSAYEAVGKWLDLVEDAERPGRFSYHPSKPVTDSMTAEGLLMRQYLGAGRDDKHMLAGAEFLKQRLPRDRERDVYYWYYATQVMFHMQGEHWSEWNAALRDLLIDAQEKTAEQRGSWDPDSPTKDTWGKSGGRHYVTCMNLLMLEVYYRHLPLYLKLNE